MSFLIFLQKEYLEMAKYYSGQNCPTAGLYGQYHDTNGQYAGAEHDRRVGAGSNFPPSLNNYHFKLK
jgi:hypothetical protein